VNNAALSREIADRAYTVTLRHPDGGPSLWKERVLDYIDTNRAGILGDIVDILSNPTAFDLPLRTRTPEFERRVLHPMCGDADAVRAAIDGIMAARQGADIEREAASVAEDCIAFMLQDLASRTPGLSPVEERVFFIRADALARCLRERGVNVDKFRQYVASGLIQHIVRGRDVYPFSGRDKTVQRRRGITWRGSAVTAATYDGAIAAVIGLSGDGKKVDVVAGGYLPAPSLRDDLPAEPAPAPSIPAPAPAAEVEIPPF